MPEPTQGESEADFVKRCIPQVIKEGKPADQASAQCHDVFKRSKNNTENIPDYKIMQDDNGKNFARVYTTLDFRNSIDKVEELSDKGRKYTLLKMKILTEGNWNNLLYPAKAIEEGAYSFEGLQLRLNHSHDVKDVIGLIQNVKYDPMITGARGDAKIYHDEIEPMMLNRIRNGTITDVSAGLNVDVKENEQGIPYAASLIGDHVGVVTRGACKDAKMTEIFNSAMNELHTLESKQHEVVKTVEEVEKLKEELATEKKSLEEANSKIKEMEEEAKKSKEDKEKLEGEKSAAEEEAKKAKEEADKLKAKNNDGDGDGSDDGDGDDSGDGDSDAESEAAKVKADMQKQVDDLNQKIETMRGSGIRRSSPVADPSKPIETSLNFDEDGIYEV